MIIPPPDDPRRDRAELLCVIAAFGLFGFVVSSAATWLLA